MGLEHAGTSNPSLYLQIIPVLFCSQVVMLSRNLYLEPPIFLVDNYQEVLFSE